MKDLNYNRYLKITALVLLGLITVWAALQSMEQVFNSENEQNKWLRENIVYFKMNYLIGSLLTFPSTLLLMLMVLKKKKDDNDTVFDYFGIMLTGLYFVFIQLSYCSQYLIVPNIITEQYSGASLELNQFFIGNPYSIPAFLKIMGYTFMSLAATLICFPFQRKKSFSAWVYWSLFLSGVSGCTGWLEYYLDLSTKGIGTAFSGILMIPFCVSVIVTSKQRRPDR